MGKSKTPVVDYSDYAWHVEETKVSKGNKPGGTNFRSKLAIVVSLAQSSSGFLTAESKSHHVALASNELPSNLIITAEKLAPEVSSYVCYCLKGPEYAKGPGH